MSFQNGLPQFSNQYIPGVTGVRYKIVRVPGGPGKDWQIELAALVDQQMADGWTPTGTPFYDGSIMMGCQAMYRMEQPPAGEIRLKEPAQHKRKS